MNAPTLVLIDIQQGFLDPIWGPRNNPDFEAHVRRLLSHWRRIRGRIIHVRHDSTEPESPLRPGLAGNEFMPCAAPEPDESLITKTVNSAFIGTDLLRLLVQSSTRSLVIAGLTTDHCVSTTTRMAANLGFTVTVAHDATATFPRVGPAGKTVPPDVVHDVALASLNREFALVRTTSEVLAS